MRRRLVSYFGRKRCTAADELADETLNRVARRLEEEGDIPDPPARYCYIVARFVFLEHLRGPDYVPVPGDTRSVLPPHSSDPFGDDDARERRLECLDSCLNELTAADRDLILEYYRGDQKARIAQRRALAGRLRLTAGALGIRACRIRNKLEACVDRRMAALRFRGNRLKQEKP